MYTFAERFYLTQPDLIDSEMHFIWSFLYCSTYSCHQLGTFMLPYNANTATVQYYAAESCTVGP